jgi:excinuclease ABC subunit C
LGIAKNLEELFYPNDPVPLHLDKKSITLKIIQQMRDEAHRFGLTHHRNLRSRKFIATQLTEIPGVGPKSAEVLLRRFGSVERLCSASPAEWIEAVGARRAEAIRLWCVNQHSAETINPEIPLADRIETAKTAMGGDQNSD